MVKRTQKEDAPLASLVFDLVWWVSRAPRSYDETMEAWRTSCPRLPVWEEAVDRGYVARRRGGDGGATVEVTAAGRELLARAGRAGASGAAPAVDSRQRAG